MKDKIEQAIKESNKKHTLNKCDGNNCDADIISNLCFRAGAEWMQDQYKGITPDIVQLMYNTLVVTIDMCTEKNDPERKLWQSISYALSQANKQLKP